jgi:protein SCO1/2
MPPKKGEIGRQEVQIPVVDFNLIDQEGKRFRFSSLRGKAVLATFVFTSCPDICPLFTAKFAAIQRQLREKKRNDYWLLTITTDPEKDTPAALKAYAKQYDADLGHWSFLTGPPAELKGVWQAFGVNVTKLSSGQIQHTGLTTLMDRNGVRRINYWGDKWLEADVLKDLFGLDVPTRR